jgi:hypothetical protein
MALVACLGWMASPVAFAQNAPYSEPAPTMQPASVNPAGAPLICKYYVYNGQVLPRRDCRTESQWRHMRQDTQQTFRQLQIQALSQRP